MGIRGTVRRSNDPWFVHCNVDTDVIVWEGHADGSFLLLSPSLRSLTKLYRSATQATRTTLSHRELLPRNASPTPLRLSPFSSSRMAHRRTFLRPSRVGIWSRAHRASCRGRGDRVEGGRVYEGGVRGEVGEGRNGGATAGADDGCRGRGRRGGEGRDAAPFRRGCVRFVLVYDVR